MLFCLVPRCITYPAVLLDLQRIQNDAALGDSPLWFGEWGLPTQFNATDEFLYKWADAQKWSYSKGAGWIVSMRVSPNRDRPRSTESSFGTLRLRSQT